VSDTYTLTDDANQSGMVSRSPQSVSLLDQRLSWLKIFVLLLT